MAPTMDIDENKSTTTAATAPAKKALAKPKKKKKVATPSASSESASTHPDMSLAQDIHRLVMVQDGKLSIEDASSIAGTSTSDLLERVMSRVGTGGRAVEDAMRVNGARHAPPQAEGGDDDGAPASASSPAAVAEDGKGGEDDDDDVGGGESLLNPSLYRHLRSTLSYASPSALSESDLDALTAHHEVVLSSLRSAITRASDEAGDMEVLHASMDVARYAARCCDMGAAADAYRAVLALPKLSAGKRLDAHLEMARVCSFWGDFRGMGDTLASAAKAIAKGGDWDRRNRLKVYQALSFLLVRDVGSASKLLVEGIATFSCAELCDYPEFVTYAIVTGLLSLKRTELKKSIIDGSEVLQVAKDIPVLVSLVCLVCDLFPFWGIPFFLFRTLPLFFFARVRAFVRVVEEARTLRGGDCLHWIPALLFAPDPNGMASCGTNAIPPYLTPPPPLSHSPSIRIPDSTRQHSLRLRLQGLPPRPRRPPTPPHRESLPPASRGVPPARAPRPRLPSIPRLVSVRDPRVHGRELRRGHGVPGRAAQPLHRRREAHRQDRQVRGRGGDEQARLEEREVSGDDPEGGLAIESHPEARARRGPVRVLVFIQTRLRIRVVSGDHDVRVGGDSKDDIEVYEPKL